MPLRGRDGDLPDHPATPDGGGALRRLPSDGRTVTQRVGNPPAPPTRFWQSTTMLVTPRPGVNRENLLQALRNVESEITLIDARAPQGAHKRLLSL